MTPAERTNIAEAFKEAKLHLAKDACELTNHTYAKYICTALYFSQHPAYDEALAIINSRMNHRHSSVVSWLRYHVPTLRHSLKGLSADEVTTQYQLYRHRWLDALVEEFSS